MKQRKKLPMIGAVLRLARLGLLGSLAAWLVACDPNPTYTREIAPLLAEQCAGCHRTGGVAPMPLETYEDAKANAAAIASAVESHRMPPWPPNQGDSCPPLEGDRRLPEDDVSLLASWARGGTPRGNGSAEATQSPSSPRWIDDISVTVAPPEPYAPEPSADTYRCFLLDPALDHDAYLVAYAVGKAQGVHHLHVWSIDDDSQLAKAEELDAASPGGGWDCLDDVGIQARHLTVWGPTDPVRRHPEGTGMPLYAGKKLMMQIHYHHAKEGGTYLDLQLADEVAHPADILTIGPAPFILPPRTPETTVQALTVTTKDGLLWGVRAHMHDLGSRAKISLVRKDGDACLLSIPDWDAKWQLMYFFEAPIPVASGDTLQIDCTYDTTSKTEETLNGPTANDEMCNANFYVTW
jgi:hypothetical protein